MHLKIRMIWNQFILISLSFVCVFIFGKFQLKICREKNKMDPYDIGYINLDTVISWKSYEISSTPNTPSLSSNSPGPKLTQIRIAVTAPLFFKSISFRLKSTRLKGKAFLELNLNVVLGSKTVPIYGWILHESCVILFPIVISTNIYSWKWADFSFLIRFCHLYYEERHYCWLTDVVIAKWKVYYFK